MDAIGMVATDLYRDAVLDHGRAPRGVGMLDSPAVRASACNLLCGDRIDLSIAFDGDRCSDIRHRTEGCLICVASASLLAESLLGESVLVAAFAIRKLQAGLNGESVELGPLAPLLGVARHASRHRCALLPWEALQSVLDARSR